MKDDSARGAIEPLALARGGDRQAFAALVREHQRMVYSLARRMLSDRHAAEDLAQEVFMQLHRKLALIESPAHLLFWLRKVTTNLAIDRLRHDRRHVASPLAQDAGPVNEPPGPDPLLQRRLRSLVAGLPPAARAVVLLRFQEDMDPTQIAAALEMSTNTVKSHLRRSLAKLRAGFQDDVFANVGTNRGREPEPSA